MNDLYSKSLIDAKKLKERALAAATHQLVEKLQPRLENYIADALLSEDSAADDYSEEDDDRQLLTDTEFDDADDETDAMVDDAVADATSSVAAVGGSTPDVNAVRASMENPAAGEHAGITIEPDGAVVLDLKSFVVEEPKKNADAPSAAPAQMALPTSEAFQKLADMRKIVEQLDDKKAGYGRLALAYEKVFKEIHTTTNESYDPKQQVADLIQLADEINETYVTVRDDIGKSKPKLLDKLEETYSNVNVALGSVLCERISRHVARAERAVARASRLSRVISLDEGKKILGKVSGFGSVLEAVSDRTGSTKAPELKTRIAALVMEIKKMTTPRRGKLGESEDIILKLTFDDPEDAADIRATIPMAAGAADDMADMDLDGGDDAGDESIDDLLDDMGDGDDQAVDLELGESDRHSISSRVAALFEDDDMDLSAGADFDFGDEDADAEADADLGLGMDDEAAEGDALGADEMSGAAQALRHAADEILAGDVRIEIIPDEDEDEGEDDEDDLGLDLDLDDDMGNDMGDDEVVDIDMAELGEALRDMLGGHNIHETLDDDYDEPEDADADEMPWEDAEDVGRQDFLKALDKPTPAHKEQRDYSRRQQFAEARRSSVEPTAREVAQLQRRVEEQDQKLSESNLLSAKLLYANKLLQRTDLSETHRERIVDALDEAKSLREAKLLYTNLTRSLERRKPAAQPLAESRSRAMGSPSRPSSSGAASQRSVGHSAPRSTAGSQLLGESVDVGMWMKFAGLTDSSDE